MSLLEIDCIYIKKLKLEELAKETEKKIVSLIKIVSCLFDSKDENVDILQKDFEEISHLEWQIEFFNKKVPYCAEPLNYLKKFFKKAFEESVIMRWNMKLANNEENLWVLEYAFAQIISKYCLFLNDNELKARLDSFIKIIDQHSITRLHEIDDICNAVRPNVKPLENQNFNFFKSTFSNLLQFQKSKKFLRTLLGIFPDASNISVIEPLRGIFNALQNVDRDLVEKISSDSNELIKKNGSFLLETYRNLTESKSSILEEDLKMFLSLEFDESYSKDLLNFFTEEHQKIKNSLEARVKSNELANPNIEYGAELKVLSGIEKSLVGLLLQEFRSNVIMELQLSPAKNIKIFDAIFHENTQELKEKILQACVGDGKIEVVLKQKLAIFEKNRENLSFESLLKRRSDFYAKLLAESRRLCIQYASKNKFKALSEQYSIFNSSKEFNEEILNILNETLEKMKTTEKEEKIEIIFKNCVLLWEMHKIKNLCPPNIETLIENKTVEAENNLIGRLNKYYDAIEGYWHQKSYYKAVKKLTKIIQIQKTTVTETSKIDEYMTRFKNKRESFLNILFEVNEENPSFTKKEEMIVALVSDLNKSDLKNGLSEFFNEFLKNLNEQFERRSKRLIEEAKNIKFEFLENCKEYLGLLNYYLEFDSLSRIGDEYEKITEVNIKAQIQLFKTILDEKQSQMMKLFENAISDSFENVIGTVCEIIKHINASCIKSNTFSFKSSVTNIIEKFFDKHLETFFANILKEGNDLDMLKLISKYYLMSEKFTDVNITNDRPDPDLQNCLKECKKKLNIKLAEFIEKPPDQAYDKYYLEFFLIPIYNTLKEEKSKNDEKKLLDAELFEKCINKISYYEKQIISVENELKQAAESLSVKNFELAWDNKNKLRDIEEVFGRNKETLNVNLKTSMIEGFNDQFANKINEIQNVVIELNSAMNSLDDDNINEHYHKINEIFDKVKTAVNFAVHYNRETTLQLEQSKGEIFIPNNFLQEQTDIISQNFKTHFAKFNINETLKKGLVNILDDEIKNIRTAYAHAILFNEKCDGIIINTVNDVLKKIDRMENDFEEMQGSLKNEEEIIPYLLRIRAFQDHFYDKKDTFYKIIDSYLEQLNKDPSVDLLKIITTLSEGEGIALIIDHPVFQNEREKYFKKAVKYQDIKDILERAIISSFDKEGSLSKQETNEIIQLHTEYKAQYGKLINKDFVFKLYSKTEGEVENILKTEIDKFLEEFENKKANWKIHLPWILGNICSFWTLERAVEIFKNSKKEDYDSLPEPHAGQMFCLFKIFGIGYSDKTKEVDIPKNFVELKTGEGKSFILGICSAVMALLEYEVYCACYSHYLSERDNKAYRALLKRLGIDNMIRYGTFNQLCENVINENGNFREYLVNFLKGKPIEDRNKGIKKRVLIIDEVDVLFERKYTGSGYHLLATIDSKNYDFREILNLIWDDYLKDQNSNVKDGPFYKNLEKEFPDLIEIINNAIDQALFDVKNFDYEHIVEDDKILVHDETGMKVNNLVKEYKTAFLHLNEFKNKNISKESMISALTLNIKGGVYSYLEIANSFSTIIGVTGTLHLNKNQETIIKGEKYLNINNFTYIPSVFEASNRSFDENKDFEVHGDNNTYYQSITNRIKEAYDKERAVIVFFESEKHISNYKNFKNSFDKSKTNTLTDKTEPKKKESLIINAGKTKSVILATREMGRGIDYLCRDKNVLKNGGILVIQTFLSEEFTEEIQIKGRCARQGQRGSYCLILNKNDLEKYRLITNATLTYKEICKSRETYIDLSFTELIKNVDKLREEHENSLMLKNLMSNNSEEALNIIRKLNINVIPDYKTLILIDGTTTMVNIIKGLKNSLKEIFQSFDDTLKQHKKPIGTLSLQIAVYRDYDCGLDKILEPSGWKKRPKGLVDFLNKMQAYGGGDIPEAVEIGLWYANQLANQDELRQVILIADAPAKDLEAIKRDRKNKESKWKKKFGEAADWETQAQKLKKLKIPIHTLYLLDEKDCEYNYRNHYSKKPVEYNDIIENAKSLKINFEKISTLTSGKSNYINEWDLNNKSSNVFKNFITAFLLNTIDKNLAEIFQKQNNTPAYTG